MKKINDNNLHKAWFFVASIIDRFDSIELDHLRKIVVHFDLNQLELRGDVFCTDSSVTLSTKLISISYIDEGVSGKYDTFNQLFTVSEGLISLSEPGKKHFACRDYRNNPYAIHGDSSEYLCELIDSSLSSYLRASEDALCEDIFEFHYSITIEPIHYERLVCIAQFSEGVKEAYDENHSIEMFKNRHFR